MEYMVGLGLEMPGEHFVSTKLWVQGLESSTFYRIPLRQTRLPEIAVWGWSGGFTLEQITAFSYVE